MDTPSRRVLTSLQGPGIVYNLRMDVPIPSSGKADDDCLQNLLPEGIPPRG